MLQVGYSGTSGRLLRAGRWHRARYRESSCGRAVVLYHDGTERLVDSPAGLEDRGEEALLFEFRDVETYIAGFGGHDPGR